MSALDPWRLPLGGTHLIEASAGTGKTHTLTTLYLRLLVEEQLRPSEILVVTYTRAATAELRERVRGRIQEAIRAGEEDGTSGAGSPDREALREIAATARRSAEDLGRPDALRRALREFDEAAIFTIHGFCQRVLQEHAFESGAPFDAELVEHADPIERTLARDLWAREIEGEDPLFVEWLLVGRGRRWQFEPDPLHRGLIRILGADEEMPVLPTRPAEDGAAQAGEELDLDRLLAACRTAWVEWADAWQDDRGGRLEWLLDTANLNQQTHKRERIEAVWIPWLDDRAASLAASAGGAHAGPDPTLLGPLPVWWKNLLPETIARKLKKGGTARDDAFFDACATVQQTIEAVEAAFRDHALVLRRRFVEAVREASRRRRDERHRLFFDDLLSEVRRAIRGSEGEPLVGLLREKMPFALIDEFQDTDPVQYEIFRRVWHRESEERARGGLLLIGDPKQAIYSFRGADIFTYLRAREDAAGAPWALSVSYRSDPGLIHALNALFSRPPHAFGIDAIRFQPVDPRPGARSLLEVPGRSRAGLRVVMAERAQASAALGEPVEGPLPVRFGRVELMEAFARDVAELLECGARIDGRALVPSDVAVLCRTKKELGRAREALVALGIPCVDRGDRDVFESREAWELVCILRAMLHPGDPGLLRAALSTAAHGLDASAIAALDDEASALEAAAERFAGYGRLWTQAGLTRALETWRREEGVSPRLLALEDGERRLTNWLHLAELLQGIALERAPSRRGLVDWLERAIADEEARLEVGAEASLLRLERDDEAVSLVTLHRSKGLEYEIVYLPSLWEEPSRGRLPAREKAQEDQGQIPPVRFHDAGAGRRSLDLGGPGYADHVEQAREEARSEALRLLYVGLTRARRQCVVFWGAIGKSHGATPLAGLLDVNDVDGPGEGLEERARRIAKWTDDDWLRAWHAVGEKAREAAEADGSLREAEPLSVEGARPGSRARWRPPDWSPPVLRAPRPSSSLPGALRTTSFSGLVRGAQRGLSSGPWAIGRDLDALLEEAHPFESERGAGSDLAGGMDVFPRGTEAGTLLHEVLESVRLDAFDDEAVTALASRALDRNGLDPAWSASVRHVVRSVSQTPLRRSPTRLRLGDLAPGQLRSEMEFTLAAPGGSEQGAFEPGRLADLLAKTESGSLLSRYAPRVACLGWRELRGYLRGFIDAVFFDGERYFLLDYKSNHLGSAQADYRPDRLGAPMIEHDYVLQYLLYTVALDRHLGRILPDYDYERHFGGVYYLFLRGLALEHEPGCGIFFDRPEESTIRGISALLGGGREAES